MKKSLLIALGVATLATTVLTMTFNATNVSDNLSADPVEPNHTYVFNKATTPLTDNGNNTYTATKTLDTGSSLALNISYTSTTTWTYKPESAKLFEASAGEDSVKGVFVFSFNLFDGVSNPKMKITCAYKNKDKFPGSLDDKEFPGTPDTDYYEFTSTQDGEGRWNVAFSVDSYQVIEVDSITLSYNC